MEGMKNMFSVEAAKAMVANENKRHKQIILAHAICLGVISFIFCSLYYARLTSGNIQQKRKEDELEILNAL